MGLRFWFAQTCPVDRVGVLRYYVGVQKYNNGISLGGRETLKIMESNQNLKVLQPNPPFCPKQV